MPPDITTYAPPMRFRHLKIGIIGGGLAGLTSAYELSKLGCDITIFEGNKERIGGRVYTHHFTKDHYGELGAMRVPVSHEATWHYINQFRLNTKPFILDSENNRLFVKDLRFVGENVDQQVMMRLYPKFALNEWERRTPLEKLHEYAYNQPLLQLSRFERDQLLRTQQHYSPSINYLDSLNFYQAARNLGFSDDGLHLINSTSGIDRGFFYNSYLSLLKEMYAANFSYLYTIEGGTSKLPEAFANALVKMPHIHLKMGHRVRGIYQDPTNPSNVLLRFFHDGIEETEAFDYILCAIPFTRLRLFEIDPLFKNRKMQAIRQVNYNGAQKTLLLCNKRFWEQTNNGQKVEGGGSITDLAITTIWYPSNPTDGDYGVLLASYNIDEDATRVGNLLPEERYEVIKREVERVHGLAPHALDSIVIDAKTINWDRYDLTLGAFCWYHQDQNQLFAYESSTPEYNGRIFFAGEHTSPYNGWMQGAIQSGAYAANAIALELTSHGLFYP